MTVLGLSGGTWVKAIAGYTGLLAAAEQVERDSKYRHAARWAALEHKPLLLIGGPLGAAGWRRTFLFRAHGCGDVCLDLDARACGACPSVEADVREIPFPEGYFGAALASHVLEHLDTPADAVTALNEMARVADHVLVACPSKLSPFGWLAPGHNLWVHQRPDGSVEIKPKWHL